MNKKLPTTHEAWLTVFEKNKEHPESLQTLLNQGLVDIQTRHKNHTLHWAVLNLPSSHALLWKKPPKWTEGISTLVLTLIEQGAPVWLPHPNMGIDLLDVAISGHQTEWVKALLARSDAPHAKALSQRQVPVHTTKEVIPLLHACLFGQRLDIFEHLVQHGLSLHQQDFRGRTPLFFATNPEGVMKAIQMGARVDPNNTPLFSQWAQQTPDAFEMMKDLTENKAGKPIFLNPIQTFITKAASRKAQTGRKAAEDVAQLNPEAWGKVVIKDEISGKALTPIVWLAQQWLRKSLSSHNKAQGTTAMKRITRAILKNAPASVWSNESIPGIADGTWLAIALMGESREENDFSDHGQSLILEAERVLGRCLSPPKTRVGADKAFRYLFNARKEMSKGTLGKVSPKITKNFWRPYFLNHGETGNNLWSSPDTLEILTHPRYGRQLWKNKNMDIILKLHSFLKGYTLLGNKFIENASPQLWDALVVLSEQTSEKNSMEITREIVIDWANRYPHVIEGVHQRPHSEKVVPALQRFRFDNPATIAAVSSIMLETQVPSLQNSHQKARVRI